MLFRPLSQTQAPITIYLKTVDFLSAQKSGFLDCFLEAITDYTLNLVQSSGLKLMPLHKGQ